MASFTKAKELPSDNSDTDFYNLDDIFALKELSPSLTKIAIRVANLTQRS